MKIKPISKKILHLALISIGVTMTPIVRAEMIQTGPDARAVADSKASAIEKNAIDQLEKMSRYLRTLKAFQINAKVSTDEFLSQNGQRIQNLGVHTLLVRRPDAFRIDRDDDDSHTQYFFQDGRLSLFSPELNYYASADFAPTIEQTMKMLRKKYELEVPLEDLFDWTDSSIPTDRFESAYFIGTSKVGGITCNHLAFRQNGIDWQVWIEDSDKPVPLRVSIARRDNYNAQYTAELAWVFQPDVEDKNFVFTPPEHAQRITIKENKNGQD